jgi:hypothetical protein
MRICISIFILLLSVQYTKALPLNEARILYKRAVGEEQTCKKLIQALGSFNETNNAALAGYRACATMIMASHVFNPVSKLSYFKEGAQLLEKCIKADMQNIEIRYLRFTVQCNAPSFLGYHSAIYDDKKFLLNALPKMENDELKKMILTFLKKSEYLTDSEKQQLK